MCCSGKVYSHKTKGRGEYLSYLFIISESLKKKNCPYPVADPWSGFISQSMEKWSKHIYVWRIQDHLIPRGSEELGDRQELFQITNKSL